MRRGLRRITFLRVTEPFAHAVKDGVLVCSFCPRRCRLTVTEVGRCGALACDVCGLRLTRAPGTFRLRTLAPEQARLLSFPKDRIVLAVESGGSGLETRTLEPLGDQDTRFTPEQVVFVARAWDAAAVHLVSDDPVFGVAEGHDILAHARAAGLKTAVTTTGFLLPQSREIVLDGADIVNLKIWSTSPTFYTRRFGARVEPVLQTVEWLGSRRSLTIEATIPILPGQNDAPFEVERLAHWISRSLGLHVPIHFVPGAPGVPDDAVDQAIEIARTAGFRAVTNASAPRPPLQRRRPRPPRAPVSREASA
jgi:pyruvate formate lyase activating enzyme